MPVWVERLLGGRGLWGRDLCLYPDSRADPELSLSRYALLTPQGIGCPGRAEDAQPSYFLQGMVLRQPPNTTVKPHRPQASRRGSLTSGPPGINCHRKHPVCQANGSWVSLVFTWHSCLFTPRKPCRGPPMGRHGSAGWLSRGWHGRLQRRFVGFAQPLFIPAALIF